MDLWLQDINHFIIVNTKRRGSDPNLSYHRQNF